jgi:hypothetical protein
MAQKEKGAVRESISAAPFVVLLLLPRAPASCRLPLTTDNCPLSTASCLPFAARQVPPLRYERHRCWSSALLPGALAARKICRWFRGSEPQAPFVKSEQLLDRHSQIALASNCQPA